MRATAGFALFGLLLVGCGVASIVGHDEHGPPRSPDPFETVRDFDLAPRFPRHGEALHEARRVPNPATFFGQDEPPTRMVQPAPSGGGYELNFENAPVATVAKVILGDILSVGYTIDPRIQGTVTISSGRPVPQRDLLFVLENALRMSNVVMVPGSGGYRLIPSGEAAGTSQVRPPGNQPGYGLSVVPLRHVSGETILKLLDNFAIKSGVARVEPTRNMVVIQGSGPERTAAMETIQSFDVDWMRGQSVGIYPVRHATPDAIIGELEKVLETGEGGLNHNLVKLQPISRLNAVLVVARRPNLLRTAGTWIMRLDRSDTENVGVRVYRVRYGNAAQIAKVLNDLFGGRDGISGQASQIAPGAGISTTSDGTQRSLFEQRSGRGVQRGVGSARMQGSAGFDERFGGSAFGPSRTTAAQQRMGTGMGAGTGIGAGDMVVGAGIGTEPGAGRADTAVSTVILPGIRITADVANNSLLIYADQQNYRLIERTLRQLDRPQLQVAVHATIAEITLNNELRYGVQYFLKSSDVGLGKDKGAVSLGAAAASAIINRALPGFNLLLGPEADPRVILDALRGITDVKVLSTPSVVVLDNQVAMLQVGDEVPIATQSAAVIANPNTPLINTIDYRNTGVILRVLPRINVNGNVTLDIEQEISSVAQNTQTETLTPTVSQRRVRSSVVVASGQSVLLGGMIGERQERSRAGIPVLEELPGVGDLFARNTRTTARTELIIFVRPQIIRDSIDAARIANELRSQLQGSAERSFPRGPGLYDDPRYIR